MRFSPSRIGKLHLVPGAPHFSFPVYAATQRMSTLLPSVQRSPSCARSRPRCARSRPRKESSQRRRRSFTLRAQSGTMQSKKRTIRPYPTGNFVHPLCGRQCSHRRYSCSGANLDARSARVFLSLLERTIERRAASHVASDAHVSAAVTYKGAHLRYAQSGTLFPPGGKEWLKYFFKHRVRHTQPIVLDPNPNSSEA